MRRIVDAVRGEWGASIRRACAALKFDASSYHYKSRRRDQAVLKKKIREIAEAPVRFGYRRIHVLLRRDGWAVNCKRLYRLYCEESLQLRNKTPKRRVKAALRADRTSPSRSKRSVGDGLCGRSIGDGEKNAGAHSD